MDDTVNLHSNIKRQHFVHTGKVSVALNVKCESAMRIIRLDGLIFTSSRGVKAYLNHNI